MVNMFASSAVHRGFEILSGQTKDYEIGICCFPAKHAALSRKSKDWLARNTTATYTKQVNINKTGVDKY
jgi:hypothetical protein